VSQRGIALLAALVAVLVAGALAAAVLASQRFRHFGGMRRLAAADITAATTGVVARWESGWRTGQWSESLAVGDVRVLPRVVSLPPAIRTFDSAYRLSPGLVLVRSTGERFAADGMVLARDGQGILLRAAPPVLGDSTAVVSTSVVTVGPGAALDGADHIPAGWTGICPPTAAGGQDYLVDSVPLAALGGLTWGDLLGAAGRPIGGAVLPGPVLDQGGQCETLEETNWGSPSGGPCAGFLPVVAVEPDSRIIGGTGQGVLIAAGALQLSGNFCYAGVIVALGPVELGDSACMAGLVISQGAVSLGGSARLERSTCAARRAIAAVGTRAALSRRWLRWP
jgi:hypothetical protein